ncbi:MAG TPA: nucleotidyltransferase family protein [Methylomusa anaerophila]|uniref:Nucleotidyltransferase n=1 Tax=Methylomusa anaerophila TaxID=1930071 RepID=A0A348AET1_9FIRM|nr:nucleotidyltransferase family protein [Methylomusa anaerophila]BBB89579.1 hypothetical protein MAMMFC1_00212 [Methylomusa anaerophila]HML89647.1 nucleotidyltransferase family protein [Methylomusa anaerophila]
MPFEPNKEAELVLYSSRLNITESDKSKITEIIINNEIDWGTFLYYCCHHRVTPLVLKTFWQLNLINSIEINVYNAMKSICDHVKRKNIIYYTEIDIINKQFYNHEIKAVMLKGGILAPFVYKDISLRQFGDIDFLVDMDDISIVTKILEESGFIQGTYDKVKRKIIPATKDEKLNRRLTSHEIFPHVKINDNSGIPVHVDINFSVFWNGSIKNKNKFFFDTKKIIKESRLIDLNHSKVYMLSAEYQIIHLCAHHYGEAVNFCWEGNWLRDKAEISLYKFCDLHELIISENISWIKLYDICIENKIEKPIYYSLKIVNILFGNIVPDDFLINLNINQMVINEFYDKDGVSKYWELDLFDRMFKIKEKFFEIKRKGIL